jgi:TRAP-type C4-dicarboxylate transport system substrate-binding protein
MNRTVRLALAAAVLLLAAGAWLLLREPGAHRQDGAKRVWNYSVWGPPRAFTAGIERAAEILREASSGEFELKIHYASALSPEKENIDSIKIGLIEGAHICFGYHPAKVPLVQALELAFLLTDDMQINARVMDAYFRHPRIERELAENWNVKYLMLALLPTFEFMGNHRIASLEDMQGARLRVLGGYALAFQKVGGVPVMVTAPETYTALERGTVDVVAFPWTDSFGAYRLHEVSRYATAGLKIAGFACIAGVSADAWNALPDHLQALLPKIREEGLKASTEAYAEGDRKWLPIFREQLEIVPFPKSDRDKLVILSEPLWANWAKEMDAQGQPGTEMLQFVKDQIERARHELGK